MELIRTGSPPNSGHDFDATVTLYWSVFTLLLDNRYRFTKKFTRAARVACREEDKHKA